MPGPSMFAANAVVDEKPQSADGQGKGKDNDGSAIAPGSQGIAAYRGGDHGGNSSQGADQAEHGKRNVGQPSEIAQQILGSAGNHINDQEQEIPGIGGFQELHRVDLLLAEKQPHKPQPKPPHQPEGDDAADGSGGNGQNGALHRSKGIAGGDFKGLPGNHRHNDLENHHPRKDQPAVPAPGLHPFPEGCRIRDKPHQRSADIFPHGSGKNHHQHQQPSGDPSFLFSVQHCHDSPIEKHQK